MPVSFVAGTDLVHGSDLFAPLSANAPTGLANDDLLLAFLFTRSTPTPPSGWTLVLSSSSFDQDGAGLNAQTIHVYKKNTVTTGDSGASFDWDQADNELRIGVAYGAFRGAGTVSGSSAVTGNVTTYVITPATVTATGNGQMLVCVGSTIFSVGTATPTFPTSFTRFTGTGLTGYRLAAAYRAVNLSDSNSGNIDMDPGESAPASNGLGSVTLLIESGGVEATPAWISVPSPLGSPAVLVKSNVTGARVSVPSPLGTPAILALFDLTPYVATTSPTQWVMDLVTPAGLVRVPISSWQATLQTDAQQYLQCVVPSPGSYIASIGAATEFRIAGVISLTTGGSTEYAFGSAPLQEVQYAEGGTNYSATLSGYAAAALDVEWPEDTDRTLTGIRTVFSYPSGRRVRCSVDWSLRPGQRALLDGVPFTVSFISYYIDESDQYMEVGERI